MRAEIKIGYHERMKSRVQFVSDKVFYVLDKKEVEVSTVEEAKKDALKYGSIYYISKPYKDKITVEVIKK